jgi:hypothetical protein
MNNGCHNRRDFTRITPVQDGWFMDGVTRVPKMVAVPFRMAMDCQYTKTALGQADKACHGCARRLNEGGLSDGCQE